jgi:hypothetical protein
MLVLHGPNGKAVYVATEHIVSVLNATGIHPGAKAVIHTQAVPLYVRETPEQIAKMLGVQP